MIDFIGIGAAKSGTTWITECLREHPEVCYPEMNELNYFSKTRAGNTKSEYESRGIKGYLELFPDCPKGKIRGEISTHYLPDPGVAKVIKKELPDVKLLVTLRQPVERAFSDYLNFKHLNLDEKDDFEISFRKNKKTWHRDYKMKGYYYKQLKPYFDFFPGKQVKVILFDDIKERPVETIQDIFEFLGVDSSFVPEAATKKSNESSTTKFKSLRMITNSMSLMVHLLEKRGLGKQISFLKRKTGLDKVVWKINQFNKKKLEKPELDKELKKKLTKEYYIGDIKKLEKLIKRDLSSWRG